MSHDPAREQRRRGRGAPLPTEDAFFLNVERPTAPQHVGGLALLAAGPGGSRQGPTIAELRALSRAELGRLPQFRRRLAMPTRSPAKPRHPGWRRARWVECDELDWDWHVTERVVPGGVAGIRAAAAALAAEPLPQDRPLWRLVLLRSDQPIPPAVLLLLHHCVADGVGTLVQTVNMLRPRLDIAAGRDTGEPGRVRRALGTAAGLAQLATDGTPAVRLRGGTGERGLGVALLDLDQVREVAHAHQARVTDVLLCLIAGALERVHPDFSTAIRERLRVAVPSMVRDPRSEGAGGNVTAAAIVEVPTGPMPAPQRLARIRVDAGRLRTPTRALGSRFVMADILRALPEPTRRWFARTVYGSMFFQAIASNMPGPAEPLTLLGTPVEAVVPVLPLAPDAPLAVGALSWDGRLAVGLATDAAVLDADALARELHRQLADLDAQPAGELHSSASIMRARSRGESSASPKQSRS